MFATFMRAKRAMEVDRSISQRHFAINDPRGPALAYGNSL
jgi:hypothetical protein